MRPVLALACATALLVAPARASDPTLAGDLCTYDAVADAADPTMWTGEIHGGPLAAATLPAMLPALVDDAFANPVEVTLTCTLRTDPGWYIQHTDQALATASATGTAVTVVPPTPFTATVPEIQPALACAEVTTRDAWGRTEHWYWDGMAEELSTDPTVSCGPAACTVSVPQGAHRDACHNVLLILLGRLNDVFVDDVDPAICPYLAQAFPPEGDNDIWDCPPYHS